MKWRKNVFVTISRHQTKTKVHLLKYCITCKQVQATHTHTYKNKKTKKRFLYDKHLHLTCTKEKKAEASIITGEDTCSTWNNTKTVVHEQDMHNQIVNGQ